MRTYKASFFGGIAVGIFVAAFWRYPPQGSSDWASWAQAVGSVGAIAAAIWISTFETRARRHERLELGRVAAAGLAVRLANIRIYLSLAVSTFQVSSIVDPSPADLDEMKRVCRDIKEDLVPPGEINALSPFADDLAEKLAAAIACIQLVKFDVFSRAEELRGYPVDVRRASITFWHAQLEDGLKYLVEVHDACARITNVKVYLVDQET